MGAHEDYLAEMAHAEWIHQKEEEEKNGVKFAGGVAVPPTARINYIATYQAECVDGNQVTANISLRDVPEGTPPSSIIDLITEQAAFDIARSGMNATRVLVLNLSRVW